MLDTDGFVRTWNRGAERLKGYRESDIVGRHFSNFYTEEDQRAGKPQHGLEMAVAEGRFEDEGWRVRSDGRLFWADVVITAVYDRDGRHRGFAKVTRDLTERRQAEQERIRLAHAEEAIRLREEFLSIAAHELRTPLNALRFQVATALQMLEPERAAAYDSAVLARKLSRYAASRRSVSETSSSASWTCLDSAPVAWCWRSDRWFWSPRRKKSSKHFENVQGSKRSRFVLAVQTKRRADGIRSVWSRSCTI